MKSASAKKILFITFSDISVASSSNIRNISLIKGLLDAGNTVDIVYYCTSSKAQLHDSSFDEITGKCGQFPIKGHTAIEKISSGLLTSQKASIKQKIYNKLRKIYYSLQTLDSLKSVAKKINIDDLGLAKDYDVMISSSNPYSVHLLASRIRRRYFNDNIFWLQYWGDALYYDTLIRNPVFPGRLKRAEHRLIKDADAIVYTNGVVLDLQKRLFPKIAGRMHFIETPYAFADNSGELDIKYQVGYFGSYSSVVRDIRPLFDVLSKAEYASVIIGNGDVALDSVKNVLVLPRAPVDRVHDYENHTRVLVCICNNLSASGRETGLIPGKAYHYGATEKEILVVGASPEVKKFLQGYGRYQFADNNSDSIRTALDRILATAPAACAPIEAVCPENAAKKICSIIENR